MEVWQGLTHPNVLPLIGSVTLESKIYMVSPWMSNGDMVGYLMRNPGVDRVKLLLEIAEGLKYLHNFEPAVIHGDLKGTNILISENGVACLADFGLSHRSFQGDYQENSNEWHDGGNPRWKAPELLRAATPEEGERTMKSDIFAFGRVIVEVFTGKVPFAYVSSNTLVSMLVAKGKQPRKPKGIDDRVWGLAKDCSQMESGKRPNAQNVVQRLQGASES